MSMLLALATGLSITGTGAQAAILLNQTPFVGGRKRTAMVDIQTPIGGAGVVKLQGHDADIHTTPATGDANWYDIVSLTATSNTPQEITLPNWIRTNVTTAGTGVANIALEGVQ